MRSEDNKKQSSIEPMEKDYKSKIGILTYKFSKDDLTRFSSSLVHKHYPGIMMEITSNYWSQYPSDEISCLLALPYELNCIWPSGYIFISRPTYLRCETERPVDVKITLPHSLATSSEDHSEIIEIFALTLSFLGGYYSIQQFIPVKKSDLTMDDDKISFTTTVSEPSLYVVGVPSSILGVAPTPLPVVPLQCVVSVYCSDDLDSYLRGAYINVRISMDLWRKKTGWVESCFTLSGPMFSVNGTVETSSSSGWQSVRRGKGSFHIDDIAFSDKWNKKRCDNPPIVWTKFFVKCFDPKTSLKFRVTVLCHNNNELVNLLLTPFH